MPAKAAPGEIRVTLTRKSLSQHGPVTNVFSFLFFKDKKCDIQSKRVRRNIWKIFNMPAYIDRFFHKFGGHISQ